MKEKKKMLLILGVLIGVLSVVGVSYALWQLTLTQTGTNVITSGCFKVTFHGENDINLQNAYPITNEEGASLTPYEFTITNTCDSEASYQVNLEILNDSTFIELGYIREMLNEKGSTSGSKILTTNSETEKTLENASLAYKLSNGVLAGKESKTFEFRLWMDQYTSATESVMEKTLNSKITVITSYKAPVDTKNMMVAMDFEGSYEEFNYYEKNVTYSQNEKYNVSRVVYQSTMNSIPDALEVIDFSEAKDNSVLGYYVLNEKEQENDYDSYTLFIQANGKIKANPNASYYGSLGCVGSRLGCDSSVGVVEGIENLDTSFVTDMSNMFFYVEDLTSLNLSNFDTSNVTNMSGMFSWMRNLTSLDLSSFDTSNVTDMSSMFSGMSVLTSLNLSNFDTSNVTNMDSMFSGDSNLMNITYGDHFIYKENLSISNMFYNCPANKPTHSSWNNVNW